MDRIYDFLDVAEHFFPKSFSKVRADGLLAEILTHLGTRIEDELDEYSLVKNTEEKERESNVREFNEMADVCKKLAAFAEKHSELATRFSSGADTLESAVSTLEEKAPEARDTVESRPDVSSEFIPIDQIFADL